MMDSRASVAVIIPTYNRGTKVIAVLEKIKSCDPLPAEIWVHVDLANGNLEREIASRFPDVHVLTSTTRIGPGGGRHRCLSECSTPYAVSFDDDSYPVDEDFFSTVERLFRQHPQVAIFGARIWHRHEPECLRNQSMIRMPSYIGCGYAIRLDAYRTARGLLPRPVPYGLEEDDLSIQLFANSWHVVETGELRVFHDTELKHHHAAEITSGSITNVGLYAFLHYPIIGFGRGLLQVANKVGYSIRMGRMGGITSGLLKIPLVCYRHRYYRRPIAWQTVKRFLNFRRTGRLQ